MQLYRPFELAFKHFWLAAFHNFRHSAAFSLLQLKGAWVGTSTRCTLTIAQPVALVKHLPTEAHIIIEAAAEILQKSRQRAALVSCAFVRPRVRLNLTQSELCKQFMNTFHQLAAHFSCMQAEVNVNIRFKCGYYWSY